MLGNGRLRALTNHPINFNDNPTRASRRRWIRFPARCSRPLDLSYAVLGLTPLASKSDVKQAYKRLALKYHPDVHKGEENDFKEIKSAYESLMQKFDEDESTNEANEFDESDEWDEWMGFEGGIPVIYNPL